MLNMKKNKTRIFIATKVKKNLLQDQNISSSFLQSIKKGVASNNDLNDPLTALPARRSWAQCVGKVNEFNTA